MHVARVDTSGTVTKLRSDEAVLPRVLTLNQSYPIPFDPSTTIKYEFSKSTMARLSVYDMLGREVPVLVNERRDAAVYEVKFGASGLASGVHLHRLQAGDLVQSRKLPVLRWGHIRQVE